MQRICVIGGSRYVGRLLVERLAAAGHLVTVLNRGTTRPPQGVEHLVADRGDEAALAAALGARTFDVVVDQVCYTPAQAMVAVQAFANRARRYVMTSTIEVYDPSTAAVPAVPHDTLVREETVDPARWPVDTGLPWHDSTFLEDNYAEGKRQAEAMLVRHGRFDVAVVRCAHVLGGGAREFTGRLAHHVERVKNGEPITVHAAPLPTVFIHHEELADLLAWTATDTDFTGPLNACSDGLLDVRGLGAVIAAGTGRAPTYRTIAGAEAAAPFSYDRHYAMSNARAKRLGFAFSHVDDWLPDAVADSLAALAAPAP